MAETEKNKEVNVPNLKDKVVDAIKLVYDPEIPVDIYELGLIYEISIFPVNNVYILMTLTSPNCPAAESIPSEVKDRVQQINGVNNVEVEMTFDPPYSQDMMSEAAKLELGFL
ncbi:SUF system Fe-S cluster assembly protein [Echinicola jeungdonensis]|uniref:SUF system Fe-S cluster assembly protein n=1 Tax=Echinicola jeungdonensis TaxID=709343 RepID=A0ABV5J6G5_9BACT|nr:SUF system Fe-S cluster assembly protein [Echinicola jeungdonensis]MDN3670613.1 SUF system Fe-S cluster assembly protein [Echinicola jeungdonensis]